jgi:hypothetical protein
VALTRGYQTDIVARPEGDDSAFVITPDGQVGDLRRPPLRLRPGPGRPGEPLHRADRRQLAAPTARSGRADSDSDPAFSPDGARLAYLSPRPARCSPPRAPVMIRDLKTGADARAGAGFDRSPQSHRLVAGRRRRLYALAEDVGQERIFAIDAATGAAQAADRRWPRRRPRRGQGRDRLQPRRARLPGPDLRTRRPAARQLTHVGEDVLAQTPMSPFEHVHLHRLERRDRLRLCRQALRLSGGAQVPGGVPDPRRPARARSATPGATAGTRRSGPAWATPW